MSISITSSDVKRKAMIDPANTTYDSSIASLITETQTALEYTIADGYLNDTGNTKLQGVLKLGMLEIITGEFIEQLRREIGSTEQFSVAGLTVGEAKLSGVDLVQQGATRLSPYLKSVLPMMSETASMNSVIDQEMTFSGDEEVW